MRAPVAPSGCPSEIPPPFGFTSPASQRSWSPVSARNWRTTDAKASLTSTTAMSSQPRPAFASARAHASGIAVEHPVRVDARETERDEARARLEAEPLDGGLAREQHRRRAVDDRARVPGGHDTVRLERGLERRELLERRVAPRGLVDGEQHDRPAGADLDGDDLVLEPALVDRRDRAPVRLERVLVERLARRASTPRRCTSAEIPCGTIGQRSPIFSFTAPHPMSPRFDPIGTRVMCSTPAATTRSR